MTVHPLRSLAETHGVRDLHDMKVKDLWMTERRSKDGDRVRYFFQPKSADRVHGWKAQRLHDAERQPIVSDAHAAVTACLPLAALYNGWRQGDPACTPDRIDAHGHVLDKAPRKAKKTLAPAERPHHPPGLVKAIVADFEASEELFGKLGPSTQYDYRYTNAILVEAWGDKHWRALSRKAMRRWLMAIYAATPSLAHQIYRQSRALFNATPLLYDSDSHPGFVVEERNPFRKLKIPKPVPQLIVWPLAAVEAFVAHCDARGAPSMGDAALTASWIGTRRQDWLAWPRNFFDQARVGFIAAKTRRSTGRAVVIDWEKVPQLGARLSAARARLEREDASQPVRPSTFFHTADGRPFTEKSFGEEFRELRESFAAQHPVWPTNYMVGLVPGQPFAVPTGKLTARAWRHTCVTLLLDSGAGHSDIRSITGHSLKTVQTIEDNYRALTADQSGRALATRVAHEAKGVKA